MLGTAAEFKSLYRPSIVDTKYDAAITFGLQDANAELEAVTGRTFEAATFTEILSGYGTGILFLKNPPVASITSVSAINEDGTYSVLDSDSYRFDPKSGAVQLIGSQTGIVSVDDFGQSVGVTIGVSPAFSKGFRNYRVIYIGGYDNGSVVSGFSIPANLKRDLYSYVDEYLSSIGVRGAGADEQDKSRGDFRKRYAAIFRRYANGHHM